AASVAWTAPGRLHLASSSPSALLRPPPRACTPRTPAPRLGTSRRTSRGCARRPPSRAPTPRACPGTRCAASPSAAAPSPRGPCAWPAPSPARRSALPARRAPGRGPGRRAARGRTGGARPCACRRGRRTRGVGEVERGPVGRERVVAAEAADGEGDGDAHGLAVPDVAPDAGERVAGEVEAVLAVAVDVEEGHDYRRVEAGVAGFPERALVLVLAPEDGELAGLPRGGGRNGAG
uniref:Uncharacterized protein n=1 Tax=Triticum urartu TaxID=4572 RepID=A0A8R7UK31_TRIUA